MEVDGQRHASATFPRGKRPVTHFGGCMDTRVGLDRYEEPHSIGVRNQERPVRSDLLYLLSYPGRHNNNNNNNIILIKLIIICSGVLSGGGLCDGLITRPE
jgi:hypothetical protein